MALSQSSNTPFWGQQDQFSQGSAYNAFVFAVNQLLAKRHHLTIVKVVACTNAGGVKPVGFVDVQPLVNQVNGEGNGVPHGILYRLPYHRLQGGSSAVIIDPKPGDIGIAVFADRDISKVKNTRQQANPGSLRQNSMADGVYLGGLLNGTPTQYVRFSAEGITLHAPTTTVEGALAVTGNMTVQGNAAIQGVLFAIGGIVTNAISGAGNPVAVVAPKLTCTGDIIPHA